MPLHTVIFGLGLSGLSSLRFLQTQGHVCSVIDTRCEPALLAQVHSQYPSVRVYTGGLHPEVLAQAAVLVISPAMLTLLPEIKRHLPPQARILGDIELFAQSQPKRVVGISGTNGKGTVTTLVGLMAQAAGWDVGVGGNIGVPALDIRYPERDLYVLELSSYQLETTDTLQVEIGALLNFSPDHLDRYANVADYWAAKRRLLPLSQQLVLARDPHVLAAAPDLPCTTFGMDKPALGHWGIAGEYMVWGDEPCLRLTELRMVGRHNQLNALAALAIGHRLGLPWAAMQTVLRKFSGLPHRCEVVHQSDGVVWVNDSKGSNVGATLAVLEGLAESIPGRWVLIAGGEAKNTDLSPLGPALSQYCQSVIVLGKSAPEFVDLFGKRLPVQVVSDMHEAVAQAKHRARPGDGVLLSPACASLDMFRHAEARGEVFKQAVREVVR